MYHHLRRCFGQKQKQNPPMYEGWNRLWLSYGCDEISIFWAWIGVSEISCMLRNASMYLRNQPRRLQESLYLLNIKHSETEESTVFQGQFLTVLGFMRYIHRNISRPQHMKTSLIPVPSTFAVPGINGSLIKHVTKWTQGVPIFTTQTLTTTEWCGKKLCFDVVCNIVCVCDYAYMHMFQASGYAN